MSSISCETCAGACCLANTAMQLNRAEVDFMKQSGTDLIEVVPAIPKVNWSRTIEDWHDEDETVEEMIHFAKVLDRTGYGLYVLTANCANLVEKDGWLQCAAHDNPKRPGICQEFQVGSLGCLAMRITKGIDIGETAVIRLTRKLPRLDVSKTE